MSNREPWSIWLKKTIHRACAPLVICNYDNILVYVPHTTGGGSGIFKYSKDDFLLAFDELILWKRSLHSELRVVLRAIKITIDRSWSKLWIESDSLLVVKSFLKG